MSQLKLQDVLKELSIQAFDYIRNGDDDFEGFVHSLEYACLTRDSHKAVQFEDYYQCRVDGKEGWFVHTEFNLSSGLLWNGVNEDIELNNIKWKFVMPNVNSLENVPKPKTASEWIALGWVVVDHWVVPSNVTEEDSTDEAEFTQLVENQLAVNLSTVIKRIEDKMKGVNK